MFSTTPSANAPRRFRRADLPRITFESIAPGKPFQTLGQTILPIRLDHGRFHVLGFRVGNLAYCTDVSHIPDASWPLLEDLDVLILDTLRVEKHPTHFCLEESLAVIERLKPKRTFLTHLSHGLDHWTHRGDLAPSRSFGLRWALAGVLVPRSRSICLSIPRSLADSPGTGKRTCCNGGMSLKMWIAPSSKPSFRHSTSISSTPWSLALSVKGPHRHRLPTRSDPSMSFASPRPTASGSPGATSPRSARGALRRARSRSCSLRVARDPARLRRTEGNLPDRPRSRPRACSRSTPRRSSRWADATASRCPLYVMTSPENHEATARFFDDHQQLRARPRPASSSRGRCRRSTANRPGPPRREGTGSPSAPTVTAERWPPWRRPGPDGEPSCLDEMRERGIRTLFYFQVDNPLVKIADPAFLGLPSPGRGRDVIQGDREARARREAGSRRPVDGRPQVIEYSDLPRRAGRAP